MPTSIMSRDVPAVFDQARAPQMKRVARSIRFLSPCAIGRWLGKTLPNADSGNARRSIAHSLTGLYSVISPKGASPSRRYTRAPSSVAEHRHAQQRRPCRCAIFGSIRYQTHAVGAQERKLAHRP